jgi:hypothetical protein
LAGARAPNNSRFKYYEFMKNIASLKLSFISWDNQKSRLKARFPNLTDTDLNFDESQKGVMLSRLQVKTRRTAKELQTIIEAQ